MADVRRIPIIGNDIYQVGQVIDIIASPCTPDATILVTAAVTNLPVLLWSALKPSPEDLVQERFQRPHKSKRRRRWNVGDITLPDAGGTGRPGSYAFRVINAVEKVGWYFLLADITTDYLVNWTSMAYQFSGCAVPGTPYGHITQTGTAFTGSGGGTEQITNMTNQVSVGYTTSSGSINKTIAGPWTFSGSFSQRPSGLGVPEATIIRAYVQTTQFPVVNEYDISLGKNAYGLASGSRAVRDYGDPGTGIVVRMWAEVSTGPFTYGNAMLQASGTTDNGIAPDP